MYDFLDLLKKTYAILALLAVVTALIGTPLWLAINYKPWWALAEIVTAPVGLALLMWGLVKVDEW